MTDPWVVARPNPRPGRQRGPRWRRILVGVALGMTGLLLILAATGYALYRHYNGQITRVAIRLPAPSGQASASPDASTPPAATPPDGSQNFLLMGSDSRDFTGGQVYNVAPGSAAYVTGQRSDVVMLLHIPAGNAQATVVSFPRDTWVTLPAYTDAKGVTHAAVPAKLNAAFSLGGAPLLVATIEGLTGLHIDHFASVNFAGFQGMVNAVGGLNICIATTRHDANSGDFLTAGEHHINGVQALALVRDRESFANQDLGRIKDQEYFLSVMLNKVLSAGTLTNPLKLNDFLNTATKSLTVDTGLSLSDMRKLASRFGHLSSTDIAFETVPIVSDNYRVTSSVYGNLMQSAVELDQAGSAQLFASLSSATSTATPTTSAPPAADSPPAASPTQTAPASAGATPTPSPISAANLSCAP